MLVDSSANCRVLVTRKEKKIKGFGGNGDWERGGGGIFGAESQLIKRWKVYELCSK